MEKVACNLCGSTKYSALYSMPDRKFFREEFFTVVECNECGLGFVNPRPTYAEMQKYYPAEYYRAPTGGEKSFEKYLRRRFTAEAAFLRQLEKGNGRKRLLDVGCADGAFPRFMAKRGWEVQGVEVSESSKRITDFKVYTEEFQKIPVNTPEYDAVTAWAVLEHVHDPMAYFRKASDVVKKGGLLVVNMPNFASLASRHLFCEDIPRHLYFYTRETVRRYMEKTGFRLEREENGRSVYKLAPENWLGYMMRARLLGKKYEYADVPMTSKEFRRLKNLPGGLVTALKYAMYSPTSVVDRILWPLIETGQILRKRYGISTYVGRKA